jgi:DNA-binding transcriptional regulator YiaG
MSTYLNGNIPSERLKSNCDLRAEVKKMSDEKNKKGRPLTADVVPPWLELFRLEHGQIKLAEKLGVSQTTVGKWARSIHRVPELAKKELLRLCKRHGVKEGIERFQS